MPAEAKVIPIAGWSPGKITDLDTLAGTLARLRERGRRIVHCHGVFDLLHIGHIRYFEQARRMGDVLVVTVTPDRYVDKGPHRPAFDEQLRAEAVASLVCVDYVAINQWPTAEETLRLLRPHVYVKGAEFKDSASDLTGKIAREKAIVEEIGATMAFTEDIVFSSTNLINRYLSSFPEKVQKYLDLFRQRYSLDEVLGHLQKMDALKVLVVGDTILDEYVYCSAIGKSSKDPVLALHYQSQDLFAGGVLAVANHVAGFAGQVTMITALGERDRQEEFIRSELKSNITPIFYTQPGAPTLVKRRFVEGYSLNKLFEIYIMDDSGLPPAVESTLCAQLQEELSQYDLVITSDFGHGFISRPVTSVLAEHSRYLAVNTQANAGNRGFHTISRYPNSDYVSMAEHELRLESRDLTSNVRSLMTPLKRKIGCSHLAVTRGKEGCVVMGSKGDCVDVPSFTQKIVDRVGAGDAFFAISSLAAYLRLPVELVGFYGNVAGSLAVEVLGNKKSLDKMDVQKFIVSLMK